MTAELAFLVGIAFAAGLVDAIAGGGGLIQLPGLLLSFEGRPDADAFGTNKASSMGPSNAKRTTVGPESFASRTEAVSPGIVTTLPTGSRASSLRKRLPWPSGNTVESLPTLSENDDSSSRRTSTCPV